MKYFFSAFLLISSCLIASINDIKIHCKERLDTLYFIRDQMDCYAENIDGKIDAYIEILKYLESCEY